MSDFYYCRFRFAISCVRFALVLSVASCGIKQSTSYIQRSMPMDPHIQQQSPTSMFKHVGVRHMICFVSLESIPIYQCYHSCTGYVECAIIYETSIQHYVAANHRVIGDLDLSDDDWKDIKLVKGWLQIFRIATAQMSATSIPMISTCHAVFRGLQDQLKHILVSLPANISPSIHSGILSAHRKLSDYFTKFDESPYYTWAASTFHFFYLPQLLLSCN